MYETLEIVRSGPIATVWMNRPEVFNAFDERLIADLAAAVAELDGDDSARVVVLGGRGRHFSAGADLNWMKRAAAYGQQQSLDDARRFAAMMRMLAGMRKPTIARVQGAALGGGTGLVAACDMAIAADDAVFATSEVKFGIIPAVISPYVLRAIGARNALRYFQSGEKIPAAKALSLGLLGDVVPLDRLDQAIGDLSDALLAGAPDAQRAAKDLIGRVAGQPIGETIAEETAQRITRQRATAEAAEGFAAFFEKRPPAWVRIHPT